MNGHDREPLQNDIVDELLSAELDGEFDVARDFGLQLSVAWMWSTPRRDPRRAEWHSKLWWWSRRTTTYRSTR